MRRRGGGRDGGDGAGGAGGGEEEVVERMDGAAAAAGGPESQEEEEDPAKKLAAAAKELDEGVDDESFLLGSERAEEMTGQELFDSLDPKTREMVLTMRKMQKASGGSGGGSGIRLIWVLDFLVYAVLFGLLWWLYDGLGPDRNYRVAKLLGLA